MGLGLVLSSQRASQGAPFQHDDFSSAYRLLEGFSCCKQTLHSASASFRSISTLVGSEKSVCARRLNLTRRVTKSNIFNDGSLDSSAHGATDYAHLQTLQGSDRSDPALVDPDNANAFPFHSEGGDFRFGRDTSLPRESQFETPNLSTTIGNLQAQHRDDSCSYAAGRPVAGVGIPLSLKMLKRKQSQTRSMTVGIADVGNSLCKAFSSMVFMIKTLQSHTLLIRKQFFDLEIEGLLNQVQRELHSSLLWLFQQVYSCTPELMVLVMVLFADFTVYSVGNNLPLGAISNPSPAAIISVLSGITDGSGHATTATTSSDCYVLKNSVVACPPLNENTELPHDGSGWAGNGSRKSYTMAGGADGDPGTVEGKTARAMYSPDDILPPEVSSMPATVAFEEFSFSQGEKPSNSDVLSLGGAAASDVSSAALLAFEEFGISQTEHVLETGAFALFTSSESIRQPDFVQLEQETMRSLIAPMSVQVEDDNYECYDWTELAYRVAISTDSMNPLLLANYAQFLFLVRKDHDRAEDLFHQAVMSDPSDTSTICRFANFLWLARRNLATAERAFKQAISLDPSNSFNAAQYAYFLWHSGL